MMIRTGNSPRITTIVDSRSRGVGLLLLGLFFAACEAPIDTRPGAMREPPQRQLSSGGALDSRPALRVATADPARAQDVTLDTILAYADEHSPTLLTGRSARELAVAESIGASVAPVGNPELSIAAGPRFGISGTGLDLDLSLMQPIQISGERGARVRVAQRVRERTEAEIDQLRWAVHCDVHALFHRAIVERERVAVARRVVEFQQSVLRIVEQQIRAGETAPLTLRLAQAEVAQAQQVLVATEQTQYSAQIQLAQSAGWPPATPPRPIGAIDALREPPSLEGLVAIAHAHRPSLLASAARVREAHERIEAEDRAGVPRPSVGVRYSREGNPTSEGAYDILMGVVSLNLPAFQRNQGERARTRAALAVAEAELSAAQQMLAAQLADARSSLASAAARVRVYNSEILPRFEENLSLLRRSFELGEIDLLALSTARERFLRMQSDALTAQLDYFVALAGLERVVGVELWRDDQHQGAQR